MFLQQTALINKIRAVCCTLHFSRSGAVALALASIIGTAIRLRVDQQRNNPSSQAMLTTRPEHRPSKVIHASEYYFQGEADPGHSGSLCLVCF